jgi:hypothetical protein
MKLAYLINNMPFCVDTVKHFTPNMLFSFDFLLLFLTVFKDINFEVVIIEKQIIRSTFDV